MGKKSRRNKQNNGGPRRKGLAAAVPPAAAPAAATIFQTVCRLLDAHKSEQILKVESKYRHLDTFSDEPAEDIYVLYAFGRANHANSFGRANHANSKDEICTERAIHYYERAKERIDAVNDQSRTPRLLMSEIGMKLAILYAEGRDVEKAISSHRWSLEDCNRHEVSGTFLVSLGNTFNRFEKYDYAIEVLEGSMHMMKTFEEEAHAETNLIAAYTGCCEFLKAKAVDEKRRSTDIKEWRAGLQSGRIEEGLCNYGAAIARYREVLAGLQKKAYDDILLGRTRFLCSVSLASTLLQHSADNEAEAFAIFQEELDRCVDPLDREKILFDMGTWYRKLHKWDQSIEALHQVCLSSTRPDGTMLPQAQEAIAQTYLEQYCADTTLDIDQRAKILCHANMHSSRIHFVTTKMDLIYAQLFYFNGDKQQAYHHLELYLDARLARCKLSCYTCEQRVRDGSVPFSCASCRVASYCGRKHQKLTWKNKRICHKVLCPLLGYWRMAKKKQKKHKGLTNEEYERAFETFFESISPRGLICVDVNLQKAGSTD